MNLEEIITAVKDNERPSYGDLLYAVIALESLRTFDNADVRKINLRLRHSGPEHASCAEFANARASESFQRTKRAMRTEPQRWVGWGNDPMNPAYQEQRKLMKRIFQNYSGKVQK